MRTGSRAAAPALLADAVCVTVFCTIGRRSHDEGLTVAGIAQTAWPFLIGTAVGWLVARGWRRPLSVVPTGLTVGLCTVVIGMLLRRLSGQGTATAFIVVATLSTAVLLLGWRAAARLADRSRAARR